MTAIVLVSHSEDIAQGTKALLAQMAQSVTVFAQGGTNGKIGTSFDDIQKTLTSLEEDAICFYDIGSAEMNLDMAIDMYGGDYRVEKATAPIVEGSFTAAVKLSVGGSIDETLEELKNNFTK